MDDSDLTADLKRRLVQAALAARAHAHAPYSGIVVGAAALADDGRIYSGCNIENASYGATVCAERVAMFSAIAGGAKAVRCLAIASNLDHPIPPCGICRQVASEVGPEAVILMADSEGRFEEATLDELLPRGFEYPG